MQDVIEKMLKAAVLAPSGENCQPWQFKLDENTIWLINNPARDQSPYSSGQRASYFAHGAAIENMTLAAGANKAQAGVTLWPDSAKPELVAKLTVMPGYGQADPLATAIPKRCSNRKPYPKKPLGLGERQRLWRISESAGLAKFILTESAETIRRIASAASLNEKIIFTNQPLHDFFFGHINWTKEEDAQKSIGFYLPTLELPPPAVVGFKLCRAWRRQKIANRFGIAQLVSAINAKIYSSCSAIGAVSIATDDAKEYVAAGRLFERIWLTVADLGLSLQPMAGLAYLMVGVRRGDSLLPPEQQSLARNAYRQIQEALGNPAGHIAMLFRIGRGQEPSARSSRLAPQMVAE